MKCWKGCCARGPKGLEGAGGGLKEKLHGAGGGLKEKLHSAASPLLPQTLFVERSVQKIETEAAAGGP
jgi:hypothetical protein